MKISVIGNGKMGQSVIAQIQASSQMDLVGIYNTSNPITIQKLLETESQILIDCSIGEVFLDNLDIYLQAKQKIMVVASNWYQDLKKVEQKFKANSGLLFYSQNFAIGNYIYKQIIEASVKILEGKGFDMALHEAHHVFKKDYPSAVAKEIAQIVLDNSSSKKSWRCYPEGQKEVLDEEFYVSISRYGQNTINHDFFISSEYEDLVLTHQVRDRKVFVDGIFKALEFIQNKETGIYNMQDLMTYLSSKNIKQK